MPSRGFPHLSQEVIMSPSSLMHPWEMTCQGDELKSWLLFFVTTFFCFVWICPQTRTFYLMNPAASCTPRSAILIRDKKQSSSPKYSISLMRYEHSLEHKAEIVCCFHTNPLSHLISAGLIIEASEQRDALTGLHLLVIPYLPSKQLLFFHSAS